MEHATLQENRIMLRVRRMYYLKKVINPFAFKVYGLAAVALGTFKMVSVQNVIANMPGFLDLGSMYVFMRAALLNTELSVQLALIVATLLALLVLKDALKRGVAPLHKTVRVRI